MQDETAIEWTDGQWTAFKFWLEDLLRAETVEIIFTKVDGTERTIQATKKPGIITESLERRKIMDALTKDGDTLKSARPPRKVKQKEDLVLVWDTSAEDWRTIRLRSIRNLLTLILKYDYRHEELPF